MVTIRPAREEDAGRIHAMQICSFMPLYEKYRDDDTSPARETVERVRARICDQDRSYYIILWDGVEAGGICIRRKDGKHIVSPVFVLPEYQGRGIAQQAMKLAEAEFPHAKCWALDTILQEAGNCHLYEKLGYTRTGEPKPVNERMTLVDYIKHI